MAEYPAMPFWTDAYLGDTGHLSTIEHGAYLLILIAMWRSKDARLPADDRSLAKFARLTPGQWARIKPVIMPFLIVEGDFVTQGRLTDEANAVRQLSTRQSTKVRGRWERERARKALEGKETAHTDVSQGNIPEAQSGSTGTIPEGYPSDTSPIPYPSPKRDSIPDLPLDAAREKPIAGVANGTAHLAEMPFEVPPDDVVDAAFEQFFTVYPLQVGKLQAHGAFVKAATKAPIADIVVGAKRYAASERAKPPSKDGKVYTAEPANWLNRERWTDNLPEPPATPQRSPEDEAFFAKHAAIQAEYSKPPPEPVRRKFPPGRVAPELFPTADNGGSKA
jgi:uncharacterized protein YdaU (DUF1376 family)